MAAAESPGKRQGITIRAAKNPQFTSILEWIMPIFQSGASSVPSAGFCSRAVTAGASNRDIAAASHWRYEAAQWLAGHLQTTVIDLPGAHMGYLSQPEHFAKALRPILDRHT